MTRILRYILQHDSGMAPCIDAGLVSLATCKPKIRSSAKLGEWVMGFYPRPHPRGLVTWAGRVDHKVDVGDYERQYRGRSDAVYRAKRDGGYKRLRTDYHFQPDEFRKDTSAPVLIFDAKATWYFGRNPQMLPDHLLHLAAGGRGHRVRDVKEEDAIALEEWLESIAQPGIHGRPREGFPKKPRRC